MSLFKQPVKNIAFLAGVFIFIVLFAGCAQQKSNPIFFSGKTMGTSYHIKISTQAPSSIVDELKKDVDHLLLDVNQSFSTYLESSEISQLNKYKGHKGLLTSPAFIDVLDEALRISELTDGAYDITVGPLVNLWGFGPDFRQDDVPSAEEIALAMEGVGYKKITLSTIDRTVKKLNEDVYIDFSSIAKGYGVDKVAELIEAKGYVNYMVEIGGEMRVRGVNANAEKWRIAVEKPDSTVRSIQRVIKITDIAIATSGGYRNFFEKDGAQFAHTINPKTGLPVQHDLASVTVLATSSMTADAWATAFMVLGAKKGYDLAMQHNLAVLFLVKKCGSVKEVMTPNFENLIEERSS